MIGFYKNYFILTILLFITEAFIAACLHDGLIRPFGGDFLVVILIYCLVKTFINTPALPTVGCVLLFACAVEISQYFHLINLLGLQNSKLAQIMLGTSFSFMDLAMYTLGTLTVIVMENLIRSLKNF